MATVLIDARNVLRSRWPNLAEQELVDRAGAWADRHGHELVLVFDGTAPGGVIEPTQIDRHTLVGSGNASADDWLVDHASDYPRAWLVTSDRALRAAAGAKAERLIGGGAFLQLLDD